MTPVPGTPSDWVSGERVFAPPRGTLDVDWLVPAVVELVPGTPPAQARSALQSAWRRRRGGAAALPTVDAGTAVEPRSSADGTAERSRHPVDAAADRVLAEALETFGG